MLLDSNILIYAAQPEHASLRDLIVEAHARSVSDQRDRGARLPPLNPGDLALLEQFFALTEVLPLSDLVVQHAVKLRQQRRMGLGDSIVAGTALAHGRTLVTRNTHDFRWIPDLALLDPLG